MQWVDCVIFLGIISGGTAENLATNQTTASFLPFTNDLIDETLKWVQVKYLCGYDPLELPPVTQDDLNVSYAMTISDIRIDGLSRVLRLQDVEIERYERTWTDASGNVTVTSYAVSSVLGVRSVNFKLRIEMLKILSLTVIDFIANGSVPEIDVPVLAIVTPGKKHVHVDSISVENLDQIQIDIKGQNFLTTVGGSIPALKNYIKTHIKDAIRENIESRIGEAKAYLNNLLDSFTSVDQSNRCARPSSAINGTGNNTGTRVPFPAQKFFITRGSPLLDLPSAFGLLITYKSMVIGGIPLPPAQGQKVNSGLYGYYDSDRNEFVLLHDGVIYRHSNDSVEEPSWPLTSVRELDHLGLYAHDDLTLTKVKLNAFIIRDT